MSFHWGDSSHLRETLMMSSAILEVISETYSELCQTSKMERFGKIFNGS